MRWWKKFTESDYDDARVDAKLDWMVRKLLQLEERSVATWNDIKREVQETKDASQAIMKVLDNVRVQLRELVEAAAGGETIPVEEIQAVHDDLDKNEADMVAKVLEGTDTPTDPHAAGM